MLFYYNFNYVENVDNLGNRLYIALTVLKVTRNIPNVYILKLIIAGNVQKTFF